MRKPPSDRLKYHVGLRRIVVGENGDPKRAGAQRVEARTHGLVRGTLQAFDGARRK
jgi:hypothetical protein